MTIEERLDLIEARLAEAERVTLWPVDEEGRKVRLADLPPDHCSRAAVDAAKTPANALGIAGGICKGLALLPWVAVRCFVEGMASTRTQPTQPEQPTGEPEQAPAAGPVPTPAV